MLASEPRVWRMLSTCFTTYIPQAHISHLSHMVLITPYGAFQVCVNGLSPYYQALWGVFWGGGGDSYPYCGFYVDMHVLIPLAARHKNMAM